MAPRPHVTGADVISSGREPPAGPPRFSGAVPLLVIAQTAVLIGVIAIALHYRSAASRVDHGRPAATSQPTAPTLPEMTSEELRLPPAGAIAGTVTITAAAQPGAGRAQVMLSAVITGGRPDTVYSLIGNDCSAAPLPDHGWATGRTDGAGSAELTGHPWTGAVGDEYWLVLAPLPVSRPPGLHGTFAQGIAAPFPPGRAPCAP